MQAETLPSFRCTFTLWAFKVSKKSKSGAVLCKERDSEESGVFREWIPTLMNKGAIQYHQLVVSRAFEG